MAMYVVRTPAGDEAVGDAGALRARARSGRLRRDDEVREAGGAWAPAGTHPALNGAWGDVWSAWDGADEVNARDVYRAMTEDAVPDLPAHALSPDDAADDDEPEAVEMADLTPIAEAPRVTPPRAPVRPMTIAPASAAPARDLSADLEAFELPKRTPRASGGRSSTVRVVVSFLGAVVLLGAGTFLWSTTSSTNARLARRNARIDEVTAETSAPRTSAKPSADPAATAQVRQKESQLRATVPSMLRDVKKEGDLSDALLLDLAQMQVRVHSVDTRIVRWTGRRRDEPRAAEVRIGWTAGDDRDREVAAIALVVGRYARAYRMDLPVFTMQDASGVAITPRAADVEAFYLGRMDLGRFLAVTVPPT